MGKTTVELVAKLEKIRDEYKPTTGRGSKPSDFENLKEVIRRAEQGYYHDFFSPIAFPKMALAADLFNYGLLTTRQEVINGEYDDEDPEDKL